MSHTPLNEIIGQNSKYNFYPHLIDKTPAPTPSETLSLETWGILTPVIVDNQGHLIDGFKRYQWATKQHIPHLPTQQFPSDTPSEIIRFQLLTKHPFFTQSLVRKSNFLAYANSILRKKTNLAHHLELTPSLETLSPLQKISDLPPPVQHFIHEKQLSLKQCRLLLRYDHTLINTLFSLRETLHFSTALALEILDACNDLYRRNGTTLTDILQTPTIKSYLNNPSIPPHQKAAFLRTEIKQQQNPIVTEHNHKIKTLLKKLNPPPNLSLTWDKTLETPGLTLSATLTQNNSFQDIAKWEKKEKETLQRLQELL